MTHLNTFSLWAENERGSMPKDDENEWSRIASELKRSHQELNFVLECHQLSLEEERRTIAHDLHNRLGLALGELEARVTRLWEKLAAGKKIPAQVIHEEFTSITERIHQVTQSVREISSGLRLETLEELGVMEAIRRQVAEFERRSRISCQAYLHADSRRLSRDLSAVLFRIVQETLTHVVRHSIATKVEIFLEDIDNSLFLGIRDNGKEIQPEKPNGSKLIGIVSLRERVRLLNGKFDIQRNQKEGTMVSVLIPIETQHRVAE